MRLRYKKRKDKQRITSLFLRAYVSIGEKALRDRIFRLRKGWEEKILVLSYQLIPTNLATQPNGLKNNLFMYGTCKRASPGFFKLSCDINNVTPCTYIQYTYSFEFGYTVISIYGQGLFDSSNRYLCMY